VDHDEDLNELFRAFEAGELDDDPSGKARPLTADERRRLTAVAAAVDLAVDAPQPPPGLRRTVLDAVRQQAAIDQQSAETTPDEIGRMRRRRWPLIAAASAAAIGIAAAAIIIVNRPAAPGPVELAGGKFRIVATDLAPHGEGEAEIFRGDHGELLKIDVEGLPIPTTSQILQVWVVGPADTPDAQVRIPVGTFTTADGTVKVEFPIAVDRTRYPKVAITLEPDDGDPRRNGPTLLEAIPLPPQPSTETTP
jgi:Anti-sigma-K factor rskA